MNATLDALSKQEIKLHDEAANITGLIEQREQQLVDRGVFDEYKRLHQQYLVLFNHTPDPSIRLEALKRLVFLNWYALAEPAFITGINELDEETVQAAFAILNSYLIQHQLDHELHWMLSYYAACCDWAFLTYTEPGLPELTAFVTAVDTSISHFKHNKPEEMDNRGQMGLYWKTHGIGR
jgi:hypothetical protein